MGRGGVGRGPAPRRPRLGVGGLLVVPLVPRHGPRVVRGRRDRRAGQPAVREHQGRPRGAARRRRRLHGRGAGHDRFRRLADDGVRPPRRAAVLRRHLLPEAHPRRAHGVRRAVPAHRRAVAHAARRPRGAGRPGHRGHRHRREAGARHRAPGRGGAHRRRQRPPLPGRPARRRLRPGPQVPADDVDRHAAAPPPPHRRPGLPRRRPAVARRHGRRRHLRPPRRRVRPLLHRRPLAGAPLREDALRPGPAGPGVPPRAGSSPARPGSARPSTRPSATC